MAVYDWIKDKNLGFAKLYDANGLEIKNPYIVFVDTGTGEIQSFLRKENGEFEIDSEGSIKRETFFEPSPLLVKFL